MHPSFANFEQRLHDAFGHDASCERPLASSGLGARLHGVDLSAPLTAPQVELLLDGLSHFRLLTIPGQDLGRFSLAHFERFANHWGAPVPHPSNFLRGGKPAQQDGIADGKIEYMPFAERRVAVANATLPDQLQCMRHESPAVLVATNLLGESATNRTSIKPGGTWHTDIEYEPLPIYVSMFLVHHAPRGESDRDWIEESPETTGVYHDGASDELMRLRLQLPRNGETAFTDTAAAFAALPQSRRETLAAMSVRRRLNQDDEGWLAPLVRKDPRSGIQSLHSPVWASRPNVRPPVTLDGMSESEARACLDELEEHVLQPEFRYDHVHTQGDVTIWNNYMTLHTSPPIKVDVHDKQDARLLYRLSCKGAPSLSLPRRDDPSWIAAHINGAYVTPEAILEQGGA